MKKIIAWIPNSITCLNLLSGCIACIFAFHGYDQYGCLLGWQWACLFIGFAAIFDFLDGAMARLLKAYSKIGAELDSLSDLISFGVAPAFLMMNIMQAKFAEDVQWLSYIALMGPVFGALRLARFNVMDVGETTFRGLPIPSNAIFLVGLAGLVNDYAMLNPIIMAILIVLSSLAMVGQFKMFSLKFKNFQLAGNFRRYIIIMVALAFLCMYGIAGLAWTIILYFLLSVLSKRDV